MRKIVGALTASLFLLGQGQAQTWTFSDGVSWNKFRGVFAGCSRISSNQIVCSARIEPATLDQDSISVSFRKFKAIDGAGNEYPALWGKFGDDAKTTAAPYVGMNKKIYKGVPVTLTIAFDFKGQTIPRLIFFENIFSNIPVGATSVTPTTSPISNSSKLPTTFSSNGYTIQLSDCRPVVGGQFSCSATVTPKK